MSAKKGQKKFTNLLTGVELELMQIIWNLNKVTIKDIIPHLPNERPLAYTTVATMVKVLEQKGFLGCQKDSYAHVFIPLVTKTEYESTCIDHMVTHVFDGEPGALVERLIQAKNLQEHDILAIEEVLKQLLPAKKSIEA